jgi:dipeptidyl aminopeptidase/acylaminoacyl peptidase
MYQDISAVWHAEKLTGALLMYHGMQDQNMGTFPEHSERMFMALEALGKPAALYMYPFEDHGQIAMETRLDMWARWIAWLDKWVKNPDVPKQEESKPEGGIPPLAWKVDLQG